MKRAVALLGPEEVQEIVRKEGKIEVRCSRMHHSPAFPPQSPGNMLWRAAQFCFTAAQADAAALFAWPLQHCWTDGM